MKKGVVLLISLSIISLISILIIENLTNINRLIDKKNINVNQSDTIMIAKKFKEQIMNLINENKDNIADILPLYSIDLAYQNNEAVINYISFNEKTIDINSFKTSNAKFMYHLKENKKDTISNRKQLDYIITSYLIKNDDNDISQLKDEFTYLEKPNEKEYIECEFSFSYSGIKTSVWFVFELGKEKAIEFEIWN